MLFNEVELAINGLRFVGLPWAVEFGKKIPVLGFDIDEQRILQLAAGVDRIPEIDSAELKQAELLLYTNKVADNAVWGRYIHKRQGRHLK
jgi:UDP-N-acetyl-D-galactosamine dehydrogenase